MPLPVLAVPLAAGALGFGGGFLASNGLGNIVKLGAVAAGAYWLYKNGG